MRRAYNAEIVGSNPTRTTILLVPWQSWLMRRAYNAEIVGSSPTGTTIFCVRVYTAINPNPLTFNQKYIGPIPIRFNVLFGNCENINLYSDKLDRHYGRVG